MQLDKVSTIEVKGAKVASILKITVGGRATQEVAHFEDVSEAGKLRGLVKVTFGALGILK